MGVWACAQAWACLGEHTVAGGGSVWYAAKGPPRAGADIHGAVLQRRNQPLHLALREGKGHDATARLLLEKGAPVDAVNRVGAWECGHVEKLGHTWERTGLLWGQCVVCCERATGGRC